MAYLLKIRSQTFLKAVLYNIIYIYIYHMKRNSQDMKLSRIGREPVRWPSNVKVCVSDCTVFVEGPMGKVSRRLPQLGFLQVRFFEPDGRETILSNKASSLILEIPKPLDFHGKERGILFKYLYQTTLSYDESAPVLDYKSQSDKPLNYSTYKSLVGSYRTAIYNLVAGVTTGFCKKLRLVGVGYKAEVHENVDEKSGKKGEQEIYRGGKEPVVPLHLLADFTNLQAEYRKCLLKVFSEWPLGENKLVYVPESCITDLNVLLGVQVLGDSSKFLPEYNSYFQRMYDLFDASFFLRLLNLDFPAFSVPMRDSMGTQVQVPGASTNQHPWVKVPPTPYLARIYRLLLGARNVKNEIRYKNIKNDILKEIEHKFYCITADEYEYSNVELPTDYLTTFSRRLLMLNHELSPDFFTRIVLLSLTENIQRTMGGLKKNPEEQTKLGDSATSRGKKTILLLRVGYSHPVGLIVPQGLEVKVDGSTIMVSGVSKERVTSFAAKVRCVRPPEPYKGKGILYEGEFVRRKAGKTAKSGKKSR
jgi:ribosomal protein L6P/L9E